MTDEPSTDTSPMTIPNLAATAVWCAVVGGVATLAGLFASAGLHGAARTAVWAAVGIFVAVTLAAACTRHSGKPQ